MENGAICPEMPRLPTTNFDGKQDDDDDGDDDNNDYDARSKACKGGRPAKPFAIALSSQKKTFG